MSGIKTIAANGLSFGYYEEGHGPLVLCLHGFPDHARSFRHQLPALAAAGYRAVAPFLRGYAPTENPADGDYTMKSICADMLALIPALGEEKAHVIGHDWGAVAAYAMAATKPEALGKMVTMAVPFGANMAMAMMTNFAQQKRSWYMFFFQLPMAEMAVSANKFAFLEGLWKDWSPGWAYPKDEMDALKATFAKPKVVSAALGYYRAMFKAGPGGAGGAQKIAVPTLTLRGATDGCVGGELYDGMEKSFSGPFTLKTIDGAGHFMHQEKPDIVNRLILDFLKS